MNKNRNCGLDSIASTIHGICLDVERHIVGHSETDAITWAKTNSTRHAHTIQAILDYVYGTNKKNLRVLNASGVACGHQDFSIVHFLCNNTNIDVEWTAFESPNSRFLSVERFQEYLTDLRIRLELSDFSKTTKLYGNEEEVYDVVLFTEIAEHLDHSILLNALAAIRSKMKQDGVVIVTTPNLTSLTNRLRILLGNGDGPYWGDGTQNLQNGLYGHIVIYDIYRLKRLMSDVGYRIERAYTFTPGYGPEGNAFIKQVVHRIADLISVFVKNSRTTLFISATKSQPQKIPFQT